MANLHKIVYLTEAQLATLIADGEITVGAQTVVYNENDIYMTPSNAGIWGTITGTLSNQTDLQTALDERIPIANNAGFHNSIYRGKYLGTSVTAAQYAAIDSGTFDDLFIGDYWTINGVNWRIAAFDYWLNTGDTKCTTHHIVIVPDSCIATAKINNSASAAGAYVGSNYYTGSNSNTGKATAKTAIESAFGSAHILSHREYLANAITNSYETGGSWYDSTFELMSERMVLGCEVYHNFLHAANSANFLTNSNTQLPLFRMDASKIYALETYWLRNVTYSSEFARVGASGIETGESATTDNGIRPAFGLIAEQPA